MKKPQAEIEVGEISVDLENYDTWVTLEWARPDNRVGRLQAPFGNFSDYRGFRKQLMNKDCRIPNGGNQWQDEVRRLCSIVDKRLEENDRITNVTRRVGWTDDLKGFVLPNRTLGNGPKFISDNLENFIEVKCAGSFEGWINEVAGPARFSSRFMLLISAAFAAPLLKIMNWPSFGMNLSGPSSSGKTSALKAAQSTLTSGELRPHGVTKRAAEQLAKGHNGVLLALDETGILNSNDRTISLRQLTYQLFSERSDAVAREYRKANQESGEEWKLIMESTSEGPIYSGPRKEGELVRLIDVLHPEKSVSGLIDRLKCASPKRGRERARQIIDRINKGIAANYGHALPRFVADVIRRRQKAVRLANDYYEEFRARHAEEAITPLQNRLLNEFAICYAAGRLAIEFEVLPWREKSLRGAIGRSWIYTLNAIPDEKRDAEKLAREICEFALHGSDLLVREGSPLQSDFNGHDGVRIERQGSKPASILIPYHRLQSKFGKEILLSLALRLLKKNGSLRGEKNRNVYTDLVAHDKDSKKRYYHFNAAIAEDFLAL